MGGGKRQTAAYSTTALLLEWQNTILSSILTVIFTSYCVFPATTSATLGVLIERK